MNNWNNLSMAQRAGVMRLAVENGVYDLDTIRGAYNEFAEDGDTKPDWSYDSWKRQIAEHMGIRPDEDNTYDYEAYFNKYPEEAWKMLKGDPTAHFTDEFKTVYHPTFSSKSIGNDGSIYSGVKNPRTNPQGLVGGSWSPDYKVFTMSPDGYRGPVSMDERKWYLENAEDNGVQLREADGSLPIYDGILWGGVLPNVTVYGMKHSNGGKIHIKPENRGKFTRLKERTGHSATWFKEHGTPAQRKMATFALNARHWKHGLGGNLFETGGPKRPPIPRHPKTREQDPAAWDAYQDWLLQYGYEETKPYRDAAQIEYRDEVSERNERAAEKFNKEYNNVVNQLTDASTSIPFTAEAIKQAANEQRQEALDKLHDYKLGIRSLATASELGLSGTSLLGAYSNWRNWANAANATKRTIANLLQKAQAPAQLGGVGIDAYQTLDAYGNNAFDTYYNGASGILGSAGTIGAMDVFRGRYPKVDRALDAMGILQNAGDFLKFGYDKLTGNERAVGGPLVEAANIYDGTSQPTQQMNRGWFDFSTDNVFPSYSYSADTEPIQQGSSSLQPVKTFKATLPEITVTRNTKPSTWFGVQPNTVVTMAKPKKKKPKSSWRWTTVSNPRMRQLTASDAAKAFDAAATPVFSWALPNPFRAIDAAQKGDVGGVALEGLKAVGLKGAGALAASPSLVAPGGAFWTNPITKMVVPATGASEGFNALANFVGGYNSWGEGVSDVVNQATGWNPQDSWWGQALAEATNPGWLVNPSRVMGAVDRVGSAVERGAERAATAWNQRGFNAGNAPRGLLSDEPLVARGTSEITAENAAGITPTSKEINQMRFPSFDLNINALKASIEHQIAENQWRGLTRGENDVFNYLGSERHINRIMESGVSRERAIKIAQDMRDNAMATDRAIDYTGGEGAYHNVGEYDNGFFDNHRITLNPRYTVMKGLDEQSTYENVIHELGGHGATLGYKPGSYSNISERAAGWYEDAMTEWSPYHKEVYEHNSSLKPVRKPEYEGVKDPHIEYLEGVDEYSARARAANIDSNGSNRGDFSELYKYFTKESVDKLKNGVWGLFPFIGLGTLGTLYGASTDKTSYR